MGRSLRLHHAFALAALFLVASPACAKAPPTPPEPAETPDWAAAARSASSSLTSALFDPSSVELKWTSGFQWGHRKPVIGRREFGWTACVSINAKNRMGGYTGAQPYIVFIHSVRKTPEVAPLAEYFSICDTGPSVPPQTGLIDINPNQPHPASTAASIADEIRKLAELRNDGILTESEFQQRKDRLLSQ